MTRLTARVDLANAEFGGTNAIRTRLFNYLAEEIFFILFFRHLRRIRLGMLFNFSSKNPSAFKISLDRYARLRPWFFKLDAEKSHDLSLKWLDRLHRWGLAERVLAVSPVADLPTRLLGLNFRNPVGLAAGLDKNAHHIDALATLGFGFIEVGTVTPRPQSGAPRPRLFRLTDRQAIINRMGFNNVGLDTFLQGLSAANYRKHGGILGVNIGKNATTAMEYAIDDYLTCLNAVYVHADYITVNISSPNTTQLRHLQSGNALYSLLAAFKHNREILADMHKKQVPLLIKIAPDLSDQEVGELADAIMHYGMNGIIATNTTTTRHQVVGVAHANESGGLSGAPLQTQSNHVIRLLKQQLNDDVAIVGVGGIMQGEDALQKTLAGANLVQLYTGLIYRGPGLVSECIEALRSGVTDDKGQ